MKRFVLFLMLVSVYGLCFASATAIPEQGSKGAAMGNAFVATADDPSALFYNPAGIAFLKGYQFSFNTTYIKSDIKYQSPTLGSYKNNAKNFFIPSIYLTMPLTENVFFGLSVTAPFNLATDWSDNFPGRFASRHAKIVTINYHPVIAYKFDDRNAISIGVDYYDSQINLIRNSDTTILSSYVQDLAGNAPYTIVPSEVSVDTKVRDQAFAFDIGYLFKSLPWSFGLTYKSKPSLKYKGYASFEASPYLHNGNDKAFIGQEVNFDLDSVPETIQAGVAYENGNLRSEFDAQWSNWSQWDYADVHFKKHTIGGVWVWAGAPVLYTSVPVVKDEILLFDWEDSMTYRLGFNYKWSDRTEVRWGIVYDEAPVPDKTLTPVLPDKDRWMFSFGAGHNFGKWKIDWFGQYIKFKNGDITSSNICRFNNNGLYDYPMTPDGKYKGKSFLCGVQLTYTF
jgi:long-chain fatty acid transport protein